jgi:hypothetical protein
MDFLDPKKQKAHARRLMIGYMLIGLSLILGTTILLYRAYGFELGNNGQVIQQGLVFISSQPNPANIYLDKRLDGTTNKRIFLQAGQYTFRLTRSGYRPWVRDVTVQGGSVEHFDYPVLFPTTLQSSVVKDYAATPAFTTQSPSRQWLLVASPTTFGQFDEFNLNQTKPSQVVSSEATITVPSNVLTPSSGPQSWALEQWSTDNQHVILKHTFEEDGQPASEYILLNRQDPTQSVNLTNTLGTNPTELRFINNNYTNYYVYNQTAETLDTATLSAPTPQAYLQKVLGFNSYGSNLVLYATSQGAVNGKAWINLRQGTTTYPIRQVVAPAGTQYLLDFTQYSGDWYIAAGVAADNEVGIYQDPQAQLQAEPDQALAPIAILKVPDPNQVVFSANAQFIMAESGTSFAVYDVQNDKSYAYQDKAPLDAPQQYATWMDGDRIMYVSNGKLVVFDFDSANQQTLMPALPGLLPAFDDNYRYAYSFVNVPATGSTPAETALEATAMLTQRDL